MYLYDGRLVTAWIVGRVVVPIGNPFAVTVTIVGVRHNSLLPKTFGRVLFSNSCRRLVVNRLHQPLRFSR